MLAVGQATTFRQSDEDYGRYLLNIANRGLPPKEHIDATAVSELLHELVDKGYVRNGSARYSLTPQSLQQLVDRAEGTKSKKRPATAAVETVADPPEGEVAIIAPAGLPLLEGRFKIDEDKLDVDQHNLNITFVRSIGHRSLEILAELEATPGHQLSVRRGSVAGDIRRRLATPVGNDSYLKSIRTLHSRGMVGMDDKGRRAWLTEKGRQTIAILKAYPDHLRQENVSRKVGPATFAILDLLAQKSGLHDLEQATEDQLEWLMTDHDSYIPGLASELNMSTDALTRRLYELRENGYLNTRRDQQHAGGASIIGLKLEPAGLEYVIKARAKTRQSERVIPEEEVDEAQELIEACIHLADGLNKSEISQELVDRYDHRHLFEYGRQEFNKEVKRLQELYKELRQDYIWELSPGQS